MFHTCTHYPSTQTTTQYSHTHTDVKSLHTLQTCTPPPSTYCPPTQAFHAAKGKTPSLPTAWPMSLPVLHTQFLPSAKHTHATQAYGPWPLCFSPHLCITGANEGHLIHGALTLNTFPYHPHVPRQKTPLLAPKPIPGSRSMRGIQAAAGGRAGVSFPGVTACIPGGQALAGDAGGNKTTGWGRAGMGQELLPEQPGFP